MKAIEKLFTIAESEDTLVFRVPLVHITHKKLMTLNTANSMHYRSRMSVKNKYKALINPIIKEIDRFSSGHLHIIFQIYFSDRRSRDLDNNIYITKWLQDSLTDNLCIDDDKNVSFSFLPAISDPALMEHYCEVTIIDLQKNNYFERLKNNEEQESK